MHRAANFDVRQRTGALLAAFVLTLAVTLSAQQRDARLSQTGTGEIAGVVMSADATPQPIRRAIVTLAGDLPESRSVITDDAGRFMFGRLPAGRFTIGAKKAAYLPAQHGASKPGRAGSALVLGAADKRNVTITMFKGAVITGTLRDDTGIALPGVAVAALDARVLAANPLPPDPVTVTTDDRGIYRFFGLPPSEYVVVAAPVPSGSGEMAVRPAAELDALFAALTDRQSRQTMPGNAPPLPPARQSVGYSPIYYPGTPMYREAQRVRVSAGEEKGGVDFAASRVRVASITGVISGETPNLAAVVLAIIPDSPRLSGIPGTLGMSGVGPNTRGEFTYGNVPPGRYRIVARARKGPPDPNAPPPPPPAGGRGGALPANVKVQNVGDMLYGVADVDVRGQDVTGIHIPMQLGGFMAGTLVFDAERAPIPDDVTLFRVGVQQVVPAGLAQSGGVKVGGAINSIQPVNVKDDGTFLITGIGPSTYFVTCQIPASQSSVWKVRSAMFEGRDLLDSFVEGPFVQLHKVVVTLSDKRTEIAGTMQSASGQPVSDYYVVAFSADRSNWRHGSRRNASARPATNGHFVISDLPAGEYYLAALTDLDPLEWQEASFLEQVAPAAVKVRLSEGEKKTQDLRVK